MNGILFLRQTFIYELKEVSKKKQDWNLFIINLLDIKASWTPVFSRLSQFYSGWIWTDGE